MGRQLLEGQHTLTVRWPVAGSGRHRWRYDPSSHKSRASFRKGSIVHIIHTRTNLKQGTKIEEKNFNDHAEKKTAWDGSWRSYCGATR
jgi:hypothetical protein